MHIADGVWQGGLSGVAFTRGRGTGLARDAGLPAGGADARGHRLRTQHRASNSTASRRCPACSPTWAWRRWTTRARRCRGCAPRWSASPTPPAARRPPTGRWPPQPRHRAFGADVRVRHLIGLDPGREAVAVAEMLQPGMRIAFCQRDVAAARRDLVRICSEIRDELAPEAVLLPAGGRRRRRPLTAHRRRHLRQLRRPWRAALRRAVGGTQDRAARLGRRAAGGLLCRRRDRPPPPVRLHGGAHRLHQPRMTLNTRPRASTHATLAALLFRRATQR